MKVGGKRKLSYPPTSPLTTFMTLRTRKRAECTDARIIPGKPAPPAAATNPLGKKLNQQGGRRRSSLAENLVLIASLQPPKKDKHRQDVDHSLVHPDPRTTISGGGGLLYEILVIGASGSGAHALASRFLDQPCCSDSDAAPPPRRVVQCGGSSDDTFVTATARVYRQLGDVPRDHMARACGAVFVASSKDATQAAETNELSCRPCVLVVSQQDALSKQPQVLSSAAVADSIRHPTFLVSALTGQNVDEAFASVLLRAREQREQQPQKKPKPKQQQQQQQRCIVS